MINLQIKRYSNLKIYELFKEVEMPIMFISAQMELDGICIDKEYSQRIQIKYHKQLDELNKKIDNALKDLKPKIDAWRMTDDAKFQPPKKTGEGKGKSKSEQLADPPEVTSPTQLAILIYDVLGHKEVDKKNPRGTGAKILEKLKNDLPICDLILEQRGLTKLLDAFIDSLPKQVSEVDGRVHAHFNQLGTDTGRFSCSEPNLQQLPSKNHEVRLMFCAQPGYTLVGSDFSQQEPRCLTALSKDPKFLDAYQNGKDMYATLGAGIYQCDYWDCMEHYQDGTKNEEGAKRRKKMKVVLLAMMYGMGANTLSQSLNCPREEAQKILDDFKIGFPVAQEWMNKSQEFAIENGYVEDYWGRRRRLPDIQLPDYEVMYSKFGENATSEFNPLLETLGKYINNNTKEIKYYEDELKKCKYKRDVDNLKESATKKGIYIKDNTEKKSTALRQCVNARVQGSAATMTKKAMINISRDEEMKKLGFKMLIGVHDELIGECPIENSEKVAERLTYLMKSCVPELPVPFKCDAEIETSWYRNEYCSSIHNEYKKLISGDKEEGILPVSEEEAFRILCENHIESLPDFLRVCLNTEV